MALQTVPICGSFQFARQGDRPAHVCYCFRPPKRRTRMLPLLSPPHRCLSLHPPSRLSECKLRSYFRPVVIIAAPALSGDSSFPVIEQPSVAAVPPSLVSVPTLLPASVQTLLVAASALLVAAPALWAASAQAPVVVAAS